ncbi:hypothetical protein LG047_00570 [Methylocystis sp. WRRC1]|uniref:hypothetical protein n=1 Tax=Methylocystis sp. WRRC1 TaxID=1732014 RepID=UPI001D15A4AC|nr:hypothetical protein [Methylocystis sp. WRRC1]MCC3243830.1 hypothetical protein [Methylocystis sp. WRRC1]
MAWDFLKLRERLSNQAISRSEAISISDNLLQVDPNNAAGHVFRLDLIKAEGDKRKYLEKCIEGLRQLPTATPIARRLCEAVRMTGANEQQIFAMLKPEHFANGDIHGLYDDLYLAAISVGAEEVEISVSKKMLFSRDRHWEPLSQAAKFYRRNRQLFETIASPGRLAKTLTALIDSGENGRGAYLIRLGDGEGNIIGGYQNNDAFRLGATKDACSLIWGEELSTDAFATMAKGLIKATANADAIGLADGRRLERLLREGKFRGFVGDIDAWKACASHAESKLVQNNFHRFQTHVLLNALRGARSVSMVGPYDVGETLRAKQISCAKFFQIPHESSNMIHGVPALLKWYREEWAGIHFDREVVVVGGGPIGKMMCQDVIAKGGSLAIDIGSLFDELTGVKYPSVGGRLAVSSDFGIAG